MSEIINQAYYYELDYMYMGTCMSLDAKRDIKNCVWQFNRFVKLSVVRTADLEFESALDSFPELNF